VQRSELSAKLPDCERGAIPPLGYVYGIRTLWDPSSTLGQDETVYFDARQEEDFRWASPVQVYLELMAGDKRDRDTAEQVKSFLLKNVGSVR